MASPSGRKKYDETFSKMMRTPPSTTRTTKTLSQQLQESEDRKLPPKPTVHRQLDFSPAAPEHGREAHSELQALKNDNQQLRDDSEQLKQQMNGITDLLAQLLAQQQQAQQQAQQPARQQAQQQTQQQTLQAQQPAPQAQQEPQTNSNLTDTVAAEAAKLAASLLAGGKPNDRSLALSSITVAQCETTLKKYKQKITTVEQLAEKLQADYPAWKEKLTTALQKRGAPCRDALAGLYASFHTDFDITHETLATAVFWCAVTDTCSPKANIAAGVLSDFLHTDDPMALLQNCKQGLTGTATGIHRGTTTGCGNLSTAAGWNILMAATLAALGYSTTVTQQVQQMTAAWKSAKQHGRHLNDFLQDFEEQHREITRICEQGGCETRIPTATDCLDTLRTAVTPDLLQRAEYRLMEIKDESYDTIDYAKLKGALVKVQRDHDESATPTKAPAALPTTTPKKPPQTKDTPPQNTDTGEEQLQAALTRELQKRGLCLFHVAGQCKKGEECTYKHDTLDSVGLDPADYTGYQPATRFLKKKDLDEVTMAPAAAETPTRSVAALEEAHEKELKIILKLAPGDPRRAEFLNSHGLHENYTPKKEPRWVTGPKADDEEEPTAGPALAYPVNPLATDWIPGVGQKSNWIFESDPEFE